MIQFLISDVLHIVINLELEDKEKWNYLQNESQNMIYDILNKDIITNSAKLSIADPKTGQIEDVDLLENKLCSQIEYNVKSRERLHLENIFYDMKKEYIKNIRNKIGVLIVKIY